ncbi:MAG: SDR family oxidoreductase [Anaerolineae bacterium]|nr:SDR family oxidoreductase [Anaerolineae bacterium]
MHLLIIGGTVYLGRYLVEAAQARGHTVTLFNRGKSNADLFPDVERLHGDRTSDLSALHGRRWDAVIDTCGYVPRHVHEAAQLLADAVDHYTFISSISVYRDVSKPGIRETDPVAQLAQDTEEVTGETYGPLKALCEQAAEQAMPRRVLSLRAGLIIGPHDYTGRFPYWVRRVAAGGEVLAPGQPDQPVQVIDVRDLAAWNIRMIEGRQAGVYNATGPDYRLTTRQMLEACQTAANSQPQFTWVDQDFLAKHEVSPWDEMPLWLPTGQEHDGMMQVNLDQALAAGLTFRPLVETARDTLAWLNTIQTHNARRPAGLAPDKEARVLEAWHRASAEPAAH